MAELVIDDCDIWWADDGVHFAPKTSDAMKYTLRNNNIDRKGENSRIHIHDRPRNA